MEQIDQTDLIAEALCTLFRARRGEATIEETKLALVIIFPGYTARYLEAVPRMVERCER